MTKRRVTSHEVAERAGVSRTTVSLVLNEVNGVRISAKTRRRVLTAARQLGYTPNAPARSLVSGRTRTIGLVLSRPAQHALFDPYLAQVLYGLNEASRQHGFRVLIETTRDISRSDAYVKLARGKQIDGMIILGPRTDDRSLPALIADGFPLVLIGGSERAPSPTVTIDDTGAAAQAVEHLLSLGHQRVACISDGPAHYASSSRRLRGYAMAMGRALATIDEGLVRYGNFSPDSGYQAMRQLLRTPAPPSAVFIASDIVALGAIAALHEAGLNIPAHMAVVGFDDIPLARYSSPPLTTVHVPAVEQGRRAGELLIELIGGRPPTDSVLLMETRLVIRNSCGAGRHSGHARVAAEQVYERR